MGQINKYGEHRGSPERIAGVARRRAAREAIAARPSLQSEMERRMKRDQRICDVAMWCFFAAGFVSWALVLGYALRHTPL